MDHRQELQKLLEDVLGSGNVYFQPPATIKMHYPAIVYSRDGESAEYADNSKYRRKVAYQVTVIDRNPDSTVVEKVSDLPLCRYNTHFATEGLNHDIFRLYF
jgi:hypothetical protein